MEQAARPSAQAKRAVVLIADDDPGIQALLSTLCEEMGLAIVVVATGQDAVDEARRVSPDLILMDAMMPGLDGFEATRLLKAEESTAPIPVLMLTGLKSRQDRLNGIAKGANDFLTKPIDAEELTLRVRNHLKIKEFHDFLANHAAILQGQVGERTRELQGAFERLKTAHERITESHRDTILRLASVAEFRDEDTGAHVRRMSYYTRETSSALALGSDFGETIFYASVMHDIGKVSIPDRVLLKAGALTTEEWEVMKTHTTAGAAILSGADSPYLAMGEEIALAHHERWDGTGYPKGLSGEQIPLAARITQLADQYDALRSERPYKKALPHDRVLRIITEGDGRTEPAHFDPAVLRVFPAISSRFGEIFGEYRDEDR